MSELEKLQKRFDKLNNKLKAERAKVKRLEDKLAELSPSTDILPDDYDKWKEENKDRFSDTPIVEVEDYEGEEKNHLEFNENGDAAGRFEFDPVTGKVVDSSILRTVSGRKPLDFNLLVRLISLGTTKKDICAVLQLSDKTLDSKIWKHYRMKYKEFEELGLSSLKVRIRKTTVQMALGERDQDGNILIPPNASLLKYLDQKFEPKEDNSSPTRFGLDKKTSEEIARDMSFFKELLSNDDDRDDEDEDDDYDEFEELVPV